MIDASVYRERGSIQGRKCWSQEMEKFSGLGVFVGVGPLRAHR